MIHMITRATRSISGNQKLTHMSHSLVRSPYSLRKSQARVSYQSSYSGLAFPHVSVVIESVWVTLHRRNHGAGDGGVSSNGAAS